MCTTANGKPLLIEAPAYNRPQWGKDNRGRPILLNRDDAPLWGGDGGLPAIGAYVDIRGPKHEVATVLGYFIDSGWLMLWCERHSDGKRGDLAGTEIRN